MTTLWIDVELDGFDGKLLSIGMVSDDSRYLYEVVDTIVENQWAKVNIAPHLSDQLLSHPKPIGEIKSAVWAFLKQFDAVTVIADWPFDLEHFFRLLYAAGGGAPKLPPVNAVLKTWLNGTGKSAIHHALLDAIALRDEDLSRAG